MKKAMLFALAALCTAAVQAVTVSWTGEGAQEIKDVDYTKDITIAYTYSLASDLTLNSKTTFWWAGFDGATQDETNTIEFRYAKMYSGPNVMSFVNSSDYSWINNGIVDALKAGEHTVTVIFNTNDKTASINHNGTLYSLTLKDTTESTSLWVKTTSSLGDSATITVEYATIVPEPTALALLALGVAGLALKRKVA